MTSISKKDREERYEILLFIVDYVLRAASMRPEDVKYGVEFYIYELKPSPIHRDLYKLARGCNCNFKFYKEYDVDLEEEVNKAKLISFYTYDMLNGESLQNAMDLVADIQKVTKEHIKYLNSSDAKENPKTIGLTKPQMEKWGMFKNW